MFFKAMLHSASAALCLFVCLGSASAQTFDLVKLNGRVMDPETGHDVGAEIPGRAAILSWLRTHGTSATGVVAEVARQSTHQWTRMLSATETGEPS